MTRSMSPHGSLHSEGEDELADEAFDRRPDQAGPSTRTQREEALATATASTSSSTPASNEQRIPLDGKAAYPWADVRFFLPEWLPDAIYDHVAVRLKKRDAQCTRSYRHADVIIVHHGMNSEQEAEINAMRDDVGAMRDDVGGADRLVASTDWLGRVYFTGRAQPVPRAPPLFVDEEGKSLQVTVPDIGDEEMRRHVNYLLECNGAVVVPPSLANTIILPNGHRYLRRPTDDYKQLQRHDVDWVFQSVAHERAWSRSSSLIATQPSTQQPTQQPTQHSTQRPTQRPTQQPRREVLAPNRLQGIRTRVEFTAADRDRLARWLAFQRPTPEGRNAIGLYDRLLIHAPEHPIFGWAARHTPKSWREHYKKTHDQVWRDGTVLDAMIERNVAQKVDFALTLVHERRALERRKREMEQSRHTRRPRSPQIPDPSINNDADESHEQESDDTQDEDSSDAREVDGALLLGAEG